MSADAGSVWQFQNANRHHGGWHNFSADIGRKVEAAHQAGSPTVQFVLGDLQYAITFSDMMQRCVSDPKRARAVRPMRFTSWQHSSRPSTNKWHDFPDEVNKLVEDALVAGQPNAEYSFGGEAYFIDFAEMKQVCSNDHTRTRYVRRGSADFDTDSPQAPLHWNGGSEQPGYWTPHADTLVPCGPAVVARIQALFTKTYLGVWTRDRQLRAGQACGVPAGYTVTAAMRVQDPAMWAAYCANRAGVGSQCGGIRGFAPRPVKTAGLDPEGAALDRSCGECYLFHGSMQSLAIARGGFDASKASTASLLGPYSYFAENSTKGDEYTGANQAGLVMLVCRVVLGHCRYTEEAAPSHATIAADFHRNGFHSVQAHRKQTTGLNEFAVSSASQAYPEYVVTYARR
mmetsp:Transcript_66507/g.187331  ORF Transcript_66507/g.187331 Transcript_66507/m.187331 type:complete len:400 (-) Transcript_66507:140-1339(-)